ncbi:MAG: N-acyl-D-amino-acid deacylase family protein [Gemmatimonadaceae bacterium]
MNSRMRTLLLGALTFLALALPGSEPAVAQSFDVILRGGRVLDGTGNPWYHADIALRDGRIAAVGRLDGAQARRVVDVTGLYVAPGFIDGHSHAGSGLTEPGLNSARPLLAQGVTTVFINPDGGGAVDMVKQRTSLMERGLGVNVAQLVPHGSVRRAVLGMADRAPTAAELDSMRALVRAGMDAGAFGLSSGPYYTPGSYASTEELIELARVVEPYGGVYTSHIRDEGDFGIGVVAAVDEVIRIAREARIPGVVTHIKVLGPHVWGFSNALVQRMDRARQQGVEVFADQYPYTASATGLTGALVPPWAQVGGDSAMLRRIDDPAESGRLREAIIENLDRRGGADRIQFRHHGADSSIEGRTLLAVATERGLKPVEAVLDLLKAGGASIVSFNMLDSDVELLMRQPWTMTASDGELVPFGDGVPHPRAYGTFPRKLGLYARDRGTVDLAAAVRSMTSLPATVLGLRDRGILREGAVADIVVFDLDRIADPATFQEPHQLAEGMRYVFVDGELAIEDGKFAPELHGRVLSRRTSAEPARAR